MKPYLIVGQGLAGICLAHALRLRGQEVHVIDAPDAHRSSSVAAGIINPVTGKRIVLSWRFSEFFQHAKGFYHQLEQELGITLWHDRTIIRLLQQTDEEHQWVSRSGFADMAPYMHLAKHAGEWQRLIRTFSGYGLLRFSAQVHLPLLCSVWRARGLAQGWFVERNWHIDELATNMDKYAAVVLCQGHRASAQAISAHLPWNHAKGTVLHIRVPDAMHTQTLLKGKVLVAPLPPNGPTSLFWVGSNYEWNATDTWPSSVGIDEILTHWRATVHTPFQVEQVHSGMRPVLKDRRPVLGKLRDNIFIFNGLGAKGALMAPYWAEHFAEHLTSDAAIDHEVSIGRFLPS
jgi:glycine oxidase